MGHSEIEYDEATGLPKLRDGLFWKISDTGSSYLSISVERKVTYHKHTFNFIFWDFNWGEVTEYHTYEGLYGYLKDHELSDEDVREKADELYRKLADLEKNKDRIKSLVGIYPPKKL